MKNIESLLDQLLKSVEKGGHVEKLQTINESLLTQYVIEISEYFKIYPIEVESYFFAENIFEDDTVHKSELQKNRFGKFHFHRKGRDAENKILFSRSGVDICLSKNNEYYFGVLVRSAKINNEDSIINGPQLLAQRIYRFLCNNENLASLSLENISLLSNFENSTTVLCNSATRNVPIMIHSSRIGLNDKSEYSSLNLRSLCDLSISKQKEKDVLSYMEHNKITATPQNVKNILGYNSNWILEQLTTK